MSSACPEKGRCELVWNALVMLTFPSLTVGGVLYCRLHQEVREAKCAKDVSLIALKYACVVLFAGNVSRQVYDAVCINAETRGQYAGCTSHLNVFCNVGNATKAIIDLLTKKLETWI